MRKRRTTAQWQALFAEQAASGLSIEAYCQAHDLDPKYFSKRRKQLLAAQDEPAMIQPAFVPVAIKQETAALMLQLHFRQGVVLHIPGAVSPAWLASLLHILRD